MESLRMQIFLFSIKVFLFFNVFFLFLYVFTDRFNHFQLLYTHFCPSPPVSPGIFFRSFLVWLFGHSRSGSSVIPGLTLRSFPAWPGIFAGMCFLPDTLEAKHQGMLLAGSNQKFHRSPASGYGPRTVRTFGAIPPPLRGGTSRSRATGGYAVRGPYPDAVTAEILG